VPGLFLSERPNQSEQISLLESRQTVALTELANISRRIPNVFAVFAETDKRLHDLSAVFERTFVFLSDRLPDKFGDGHAELLGANMERLPGRFFKIKLGTTHDVYHTS